MHTLTAADTHAALKECISCSKKKMNSGLQRHRLKKSYPLHKRNF